MRGRIVIVIVLVIVVVIALVAALLLSGGGDSETADGEATPAEGVVDGGNGETAPVEGEPVEEGGQTAVPVELVELAPVVIAVQDLPRGFRLTSDFFPENTAAPAVDIAFWPVDSVPENAYTALEQVEGLLVRTDVAREAPILSTQTVNDLSSLGRTGSDAALLLPAGTIAVSMPMSPSGVGSVAYGVQHGDYVDVILSFLVIDVDETFQTRQPNELTLITRDEDGQLIFTDAQEGRPEPSTLSSLGVIVGPTEEQRPRLVTQRTVERAFVVHVGYFPADGRIVGVMSPTPFDTPTADPDNPEAIQPTLPPEARPTPFLPVIITLGVEPQDALVLTWAVDAQIPVTFALRSATEAGSTPTTAVTLQYLIENYGIPQPPTLPFALEPAIRSLRSVDLQVFREFGFDELGNPILASPNDEEPEN